MREVPSQIAERLFAAAELFAERGLNDTKIEEIAAATGIAKATLYYYFAGKEDILAFLLEDGLRDVAEDVATIVHSDGTGAQRLGAMTRSCALLTAPRGGAAGPSLCTMVATSSATSRKPSSSRNARMSSLPAK